MRRGFVGRVALLLFFAVGLFSVAFAGPPRGREGDVLRVFEGQRVYVITNDEPEIADSLLEGCHPRQKRIMTPEEWAEMPENIRALVSRVYLINREKLPFGIMLPATCPADGDETFTQVTRNEFRSSTTFEAVISAPDSVYLRQLATEFRRLVEMPRTPLKKNVPSLAIIPVGGDCERMARRAIATRPSPRLRVAHFLRPEEYARVQTRLCASDELFLIDRSAAGATNAIISPTLAGLTAERPLAATETAAWRTRKPDGKIRAVISAPNGDQLLTAVSNIAAVTDLPETLTVLANARDLRAVRRIAVAGIKKGKSTELARQLASQAAFDVRALDAFEVVEREGLSQILGEIALGQAGITKAGDRVKVRRLAAADALLLIEITGVEGRTEYAATHKRLTPAMPSAPSKPAEPSRLKNTLGISDQGVLKVVEAVFSRALGTKSEDDYREECDRYNNQILPEWRRRMDSYQNERRSRPVTWEQKTIARCGVRVTGSVRMVDLSDGLVLWETPFSASDAEETPYRTDSITVLGEDNKPGASDVPESTTQVPDELLSRVALTGVKQGVATLHLTALLPTNLPSSLPLPTAAPLSAAPTETAKGTSAPAAITGKILDVDGDTLLIGLGAGDNLKIGDVLIVALEDGIKVRAAVVKVRPRTCDAQFDKSAPPSQRARVLTGQTAMRQPTP